MSAKTTVVAEKMAGQNCQGILPASLLQTGIFPGLQLSGRNSISYNPATGQLAVLCVGLNSKKGNRNWLKPSDLEKKTKPTQSSEREGLREKSCRRGADRSHLKAPSTSRSTGTTKKKRASTKVRKPKRPKTAYNFFQLSVHQSVWSEVCPDKTNPIDRVQHNEKVARIIGKRWKALSPQDRKMFQSMADRDKMRCQQLNEDYVKRMRESGGGQPESPETKPLPSPEIKREKSQKPSRRAPLSVKGSLLKRKRSRSLMIEVETCISSDDEPLGSTPRLITPKRPRYSRVEDHESDLSTEDKFSDSDMESDECALYEPQVFRDPQDIAQHFNPEEWGEAAQKFAGALVRVWRIENPYPC
ncbi:hypothetical protein AAMO2058_000893100 [Amorphochlora amoebiformis]